VSHRPHRRSRHGLGRRRRVGALGDELERLAARCLLVGFEGAVVPSWLRAWLEGGLGGVCLFAWNVVSRGQVAKLTAELREERPDLLVAIDEEGGDVTRLDASSGSRYPGNHALGAVDDVELTRHVATAIGAELAAAGVNLELAPVADVNTNPDNPIVGVRSFGSDPELVARHVAAFVAGLQSAGVAACAKHFPGHGDTEEDSHLGLPTVERDDEAMAAMLLPFRAAVGAGVRSVMTAHIRVAGLDEAPGTLSRAVITDLLRGELGFDGVVVTDALEMRAVSGSVGEKEGAVLALEAGADLLCLGHDLRPECVHARIVESVRSGRLSEERLREAAGRTERLARIAEPARNGGVFPIVGLQAARRALLTDGDVGLKRRALVVELLPEPSIAAGPTDHGLADLLGAEVARLGADEDASAFAAAHQESQFVVVVQDAHRHPWQQDAARTILDLAEDAVLVEIGLPVWRPDGVSYLATRGRGRVNLEAATERLQPG
jgi:beta-N-acetylhexosaminidase